jgi:radical SAM superfamily enzyme YgiQ (UPF0313 family)
MFERPDIIRPPSEARSYFLPLTSGCSNNSCSFCNYFSQRLQIREVEEVKKEISALQLFVKQGLQIPGMPWIMYSIADEWDGKRIFLQDGDALVYPYVKLKEILEHINSQFPNLERIASYATAQDILRISLEDLRKLKDLKLGILYMGVESGVLAILQDIQKGVTPLEIVKAGEKVKAAGILLSVTVILGLGGIQRSQEHAEATAGILTALNPEFVGALTLTLVPGTPLYEKYQAGQFQPISPFRSLEELKVIFEKASFSDCFFSSMHASNYLSIRGRLPQEKENMLNRLNQVLVKRDPSLLKPEFLRGL